MFRRFTNGEVLSRTACPRRQNCHRPRKVRIAPILNQADNLGKRQQNVFAAPWIASASLI
jgi:hypothetical protein